MERLANPRDYGGRSLVLWNADYDKYCIAYRVINQCCEMYNKENPNDQIWFRYSDMCFASDDYTKPTCMHEEYVKNENGDGYHLHVEENRCGILFNTGCYMLFETEQGRGDVCQSPSCPVAALVAIYFEILLDS